ncbi:thrombospondin type 3 repeat-containing protein, partial [Gallibacterium anatis]
VKVQDAEKQSSTTADRKEAALDLGADPTVDMSFRSDTGISGSDNITTNGELVLAAPQGYTIDRVEVNNVEESLIGSSITLSEGSYAPGSIQVTVRNTTTGRIETVSNTTTYVVDTTAPDAPRINVESGRDSSISLPENAAIGDVVDVNITQPGKQQAIYVQYRKTDSGWEVATFQPADSGLSSAPAVSGNTITISQTVAPAGSTIAAKVTDLAGNGSTGKEGKNSFVREEVPLSDSDNDGYTDEEESRVGSDPDLNSSTPKTLAVEAYEKAREAFDAFDAQKSVLAEHGFTANEVNALNKQLLPLSELKEKAIAAVEWVHTDDDKQDLVNKINALEAVVPDVTNAADAVWQANSRTSLFYRAFWKDENRNAKYAKDAKYLNDYASENEGIVTINATDIPIKDTLGGDSFTIKLAPTDGWKQGTPTPSSASISEYRVDENGNMQIRIDPEVAKKISQTTQQFFDVVAEDGTKLTLLVPFANPDNNQNAVKVASVSIKDNKNPITEVVEKDGTTNDANWSEILVGVKNNVSSGGNLDGWVVKLEIIDTKEPDRVLWSDIKGNQTAGEKTLTFDASGFNPEDGHTYILRASSYNTNDTTVLGTSTV